MTDWLPRVGFYLDSYDLFITNLIVTVRVIESASPFHSEHVQNGTVTVVQLPYQYIF
jgi:hypothetical protein